MHMQSSEDMICSECSKKFDSASSLLHHYAQHATNELLVIDKDTGTKSEEMPEGSKKSTVPGLYPIHSKIPSERLNPVTYCLVTMEDNGDQEDSANLPDVEPVIPGRRYQCQHCSKKFGWSTDLKRHILTHTGERPFQCKMCTSSFTRNFLLQKHVDKMHNNSESRIRIPDLKPIYSLLKQKPRKQSKCNIKRSINSPSNISYPEKSNIFELKDGAICSS